MGELAEAKPKTEGGLPEGKVFVHKQYNLRNLLQKGTGDYLGVQSHLSCGSTPSTTAGAAVPLPHPGQALRTPLFHTAHALLMQNNNLCVSDFATLCSPFLITHYALRIPH
jgi:hypothetical protein